MNSDKTIQDSINCVTSGNDATSLGLKSKIDALENAIKLIYDERRRQIASEIKESRDLLELYLSPPRRPHNKSGENPESGDALRENPVTPQSEELERSSKHNISRIRVGESDAKRGGSSTVKPATIQLGNESVCVLLPAKLISEKEIRISFRVVPGMNDNFPVEHVPCNDGAAEDRFELGI